VFFRDALPAYATPDPAPMPWRRRLGGGGVIFWETPAGIRSSPILSLLPKSSVPPEGGYFSLQRPRIRFYRFGPMPLPAQPWGEGGVFFW
jgi:hypothetical protein